MRSPGLRRWATPAYRNYVLGLLMLAFLFSFLDRTLMSLMIDPIRVSLALDEVQISLLLGFSFAAFYALVGIPCGRIADTASRRTLIAAGIALWSVATIGCGLATGFAGLFVARMAVGIGEASLSPGATSLIPDYFPPHRVGRAMALFVAGGSVGAGLALVLGGYLVDWTAHWYAILPLVGHREGWQLSFIVVGLPGVALAALFWLTVREPPRTLEHDEGAAGEPAGNDLAAFLRGNARAVLPLGIGAAAVVASNYAWILWGPAFFMRVHGLGASQVGTLFGIVLGGFGIVAVIGGGMWSDRLFGRGHADAPVRVYLLAVGASLPLLVPAFLVRDTTLAIGLFVAGSFLVLLQGGMVGVLLFQLCSNRLRGRMSALNGIVTTVVGVGLAPTGLALLTEHVFGGPLGTGRAIATAIGVFDLFALAAFIAALPHVRALASGNMGVADAAADR